jgi:hypothetical protein
MTIPNSIYSEQGEKIHKPSLMISKSEHHPDILEIAFKPRLERVSTPNYIKNHMETWSNTQSRS